MGKLLFFTLFIGLLVADHLIKKRVTGGKRRVEKPPKKLDRLSKGIFFAFFITALALVQMDSSFDPMAVMPFFLLATMLLDIYIEWKYSRETKSYLVSLCTYPLILLLLFSMDAFLN